MEKTLKIVDEGVHLVWLIIHSDSLNSISLLIFHQQKKKLMPPNGVLFVENVDMNDECVRCNAALSAAPCFEIYHNLL